MSFMERYFRVQKKIWVSTESNIRRGTLENVSGQRCGWASLILRSGFRVIISFTTRYLNYLKR